MSVSKSGRRREPHGPIIRSEGNHARLCCKVRVIDHRPAINGARLIRVIHRKTIKLSLCARARTFAKFEMSLRKRRLLSRRLHRSTRVVERDTVIADSTFPPQMRYFVIIVSSLYSRERAKGDVLMYFFWFSAPFALPAIIYESSESHTGLHDLSWAVFSCVRRVRKSSLQSTCVVQMLTDFFLPHSIPLSMEFHSRINRFRVLLRIVGWQGEQLRNHLSPRCRIWGTHIVCPSSLHPLGV